MDIRVVKIISDRLIVLNIGSDENIKIGNKFQLVDMDADEVYDPETGLILGRLEVPKATVVVTHVYPKMCICTNNEYYSFDSFDDELLREPAPLNVDYKQISGGFDKERLPPIRIGDIAYSL